MANEMLSRVFLCIERCGVENVAYLLRSEKYTDGGDRERSRFPRNGSHALLTSELLAEALRATIVCVRKRI